MSNSRKSSRNEIKSDNVVKLYQIGATNSLEVEKIAQWINKEK